MADARDIKFIVMVDGKQAEMTFNKIAKVAGESGKTVDNKFGKAMERSSMVGMNLNRVIQDSAYFAQSASFGFLAVGNNIQMLAESYGIAISRGQTFKQVLMSSISGLNGVMLGVNLLLSGLMAYSMASSRASSDTKKLKEEVNLLKTAFGQLTTIKSPLDKFNFNIDAAAIPGLLDKSGGRIRRLKQEIEDLKEAQNVMVQPLAPGSNVIGQFIAEKISSDPTRTKEDLARFEEYKKTLESTNITIAQQLSMAESNLKTEESYQSTLTETLGAINARNDATVKLLEDGLKPTNKELEKELENLKKLGKISYKDLMPRPESVLGGSLALKARVEGLEPVELEKPSIATVFSKEEIENARQVMDNVFSHGISIAQNLTNILGKGLGRSVDTFIRGLQDALSIVQSIVGILNTIEMIKNASNIISSVTSPINMILPPVFRLGKSQERQIIMIGGDTVYDSISPNVNRNLSIRRRAGIL